MSSLDSLRDRASAGGLSIRGGPNALQRQSGHHASLEAIFLEGRPLQDAGTDEQNVPAQFDQYLAQAKASAMGIG